MNIFFFKCFVHAKTNGIENLLEMDFIKEFFWYFPCSKLHFSDCLMLILCMYIQYSTTYYIFSVKLQLLKILANIEYKFVQESF